MRAMDGERNASTGTSEARRVKIIVPIGFAEEPTSHEEHTAVQENVTTEDTKGQTKDQAGEMIVEEASVGNITPVAVVVIAAILRASCNSSSRADAHCRPMNACGGARKYQRGPVWRMEV